MVWSFASQHLAVALIPTRTSRVEGQCLVCSIITQHSGRLHGAGLQEGQPSPGYCVRVVLIYFPSDDSGLQVSVFPESLPVCTQVGLSLSHTCTQINPLGTAVIEWLVALALVSSLSRKDSVCSPGRH